MGVSGSLTYEPFYDLLEKPFSLSADPKFWYRSETHGLAFDALSAGIRRREGLIVLTGEIGTGKTTLCRSVLKSLDRRTFSAFVPDPFVSREDLLKTLLVDFGVVTIGDLARGRFNGASRSDLAFLLYDFLDSLAPLQAFAVLVIDEAQNLSLPLLEEIRILSELERREKLLQVVLVGQPELRESLTLPQMRQVDQRVSVRCELPALDRASLSGYVAHRLEIASLGASTLVFTPAALEALHEASAGVPRLINRLCDRALHRAYLDQCATIEPQFIHAAVDDLGLHAARRSSIVLLEPDGALLQFGSEDPPTALAPPPLPPEEDLAMTAPSGAAEASIVAEASPIVDRPVSRLSPPAPQHKLAPPPRAERGALGPWLAAAAALLVALPGAVGGAHWYARVQTLAMDVAVIPPLPPPPDVPVALEVPRPPAAEGTYTLPAAVVEAPAEAEGALAIVVASFENAGRAEVLVEELNRAGFRARAVDRDWGPPRGRLFQVNVGGYATAADVQRDLERIRQLPGGYADARIVGRQ